jgi:glycosyltransferase involved in cell wall biosynthesis
MMQTRLALSVVVIARNEAERISECLLSVLGWADEVIVVDDQSSDKTQEISQRLGAKVIVRKMDIEGRHRNAAYAQAKNEWVLSLDADERPTKELKEEVEQVLSGNPGYNIFTIPRRNFIGGYWIRWGGLYPAAQIKLFKKDRFKWEEAEVHPVPYFEGHCGHLKNDLLHYTYKDWHDFLQKLNTQTTLEAIKWHKLSLKDPAKARYKMNVIHALWRGLDRFIRCFFAKRGFRDGFRGFMVAYFASLYQIISYAKYRELERNRDV